MTQSNILPFSDSIKKRIHKAKRKRELVDRAPPKAFFYIYACAFNNLEQLFELAVVVLNGDITFMRKTVCSFFLIPLFFIWFLPRLHTHFLLFFLIQSAVQIHIYEEITLNGPWTVMMVKGTVYIYYIYNKRTRVKRKRRKKNGLHFSSRISAKTEEWSLL